MWALLGMVLGVSFQGQRNEVLGSINFSVTVLDSGEIAMNDLGYGVGEVIVRNEDGERRYLTFDDINTAQVTILADGSLKTDLKLIDSSEAVALK